MRRMHPVLLVFLALLITSSLPLLSCGGGQVLLTGAVQKGPFLLGSSVDVSPVDSQGHPTGQMFSTKTADDLGTFEVSFDYRGFVSLEGNGFYYNEVLGTLSGAQLTLRALAEITGDGDAQAYINILTHLTYDRVKHLIGAGQSFNDAMAQAESELLTALPISSTYTLPDRRANEMNILGGDTDANAYLLVASAMIAQAAVMKVGALGSVDAALQELVNKLSLDLADDGAFKPANAQALTRAFEALDMQRVLDNLAARLTDLGSTAAVPDVNRVMDSDQDGITNDADNCPYDANSDQLDTNQDGTGDLCACGNGVVNRGEQCDDGNQDDLDDCSNACTWQGSANQCDANSACLPGQACVEGQCRSLCNQDQDCSYGELCRDGLCESTQGNMCYDSVACPAGQVCAGGLCHLLCNIPTDCADGEDCQQGLCVPQGGTFCMDNAECGASEMCLYGTCRQACTADGECASTDICQAGVCVPFYDQDGAPLDGGPWDDGGDYDADGGEYDVDGGEYDADGGEYDADGGDLDADGGGDGSGDEGDGVGGDT